MLKTRRESDSRLLMKNLPDRENWDSAIAGNQCNFGDNRALQHDVTARVVSSGQRSVSVVYCWLRRYAVTQLSSVLSSEKNRSERQNKGG